jgi:hypothetical protein
VTNIHTISATGNLANTLGDLGQPEEAIVLLEVALPKIGQILGNQHPYKIMMANNLAMFRAEVGSFFYRIKQKLFRRDA